MSRMINPQVQQPQQQQGGGLLSNLGSLFSLISTIFPNPVTPALSAGASVGKAVLNPNAQSVAGAAGDVAGLLGGGSTTNAPTEGKDKPFVGPTQQESPQQTDPNKPQYTPQGPPAPASAPAGGLGDNQPGGAGAPGGQGQGGVQGMGSMTLDELYQQHPGLQQMFPMLLSQLNQQGGMM